MYNELQEMLDSALRLLELRQELLARLDRATGPLDDVSVITDDDIGGWMMKQAWSWSTLLSTRPLTTLEDIRRSVGNNRALVEDGLKMVSIFDVTGTAPAAAAILAAEPFRGVYYLGPCPVQMRYVDGEYVFLHGRVHTNSVLQVWTPKVLAAARTYWNAALRHATPCEQPPGECDGLTARQRLILELLARGHTDARVSATLSVSTRTVQAEVATLMQTLGVASRFALGVEASRRSLIASFAPEDAARQ